MVGIRQQKLLSGNFRRVGVFFGSLQPHLEQCLRGIIDYAARGNRWECCVEALGDISRAALRPGVALDGIIGNIRDETDAAAMRRAEVPVVNTTGEFTEFPRAVPDHDAIGTMMAEHLLAQGFRQFVFCGNETGYARIRKDAARRAVEVAGGHWLSDKEDKTWGGFGDTLRDRDDLQNWLREFPRPLGLLVANDNLARNVLTLCRKANLRVPEEMGLVSVDNEAIVCETVAPSITSVNPDFRRVGYEAAAMLELLMSGRSVEAHEVRVLPAGVIVRRSSDAMAIDDPDVVDAVRFIREHAAEPISVTEIVKKMALSRRRLELKFWKALHRTPMEEIRRVHLARAKQLLTDTDMSVADVAAASGFSSGERFAVVFRKETAMAPTEYRELHRHA